MDDKRSICSQPAPRYAIVSALSVVVIGAIGLMIIAAMADNVSTILTIVPYSGMFAIFVAFRYFIFNRSDLKITGLPITTLSTMTIPDNETAALCGSTRATISTVAFVIVLVCMLVCTACMYGTASSAPGTMAAAGCLLCIAISVVFWIAHLNLMKAYDKG